MKRRMDETYKRFHGAEQAGDAFEAACAHDFVFAQDPSDRVIAETEEIDVRVICIVALGRNLSAPDDDDDETATVVSIYVCIPPLVTGFCGIAREKESCEQARSTRVVGW